jgi:tripartite-type tricarboxylate transporter receptor subunit TctC
MAEAGVKGFEMSMWFGLLAPAHTPKPIVSRLQVDVEQILREPAVKAQLMDLSTTPAPSSPEQFSALIKSDLAMYARIVKVSGARAD